MKVQIVISGILLCIKQQTRMLFSNFCVWGLVISLLALDVNFHKKNLFKLLEVPEPERIYGFFSSFEENHFYFMKYLNA